MNFDGLQEIMRASGVKSTRALSAQGGLEQRAEQFLVKTDQQADQMRGAAGKHGS
jgi:hypothetical protein